MAHTKPLGRNVPPDQEHVEKYPLSALEAPPTKVPVPVGVNWYENFDRPVRGTDGKFRVGAGGLGRVRGGHCFCFEPVGEPDTEQNWTFYDQAQEGACEGFGHARAMTLLHGGELLDAWWLYDDARRDEGTYPDQEGATNRHACAALKKWGVHEVGAEFGRAPLVIERVPWKEGVPGFEVASYHWATSVDQVVAALGFPATATELPFLNSWGRDGYEHRVRMPVEVLARLLHEEGEASVLVPR